MHDADLLRDYLTNGSEAAFTELVRRYVNLVHATARRQVGAPHLAEEITQSVFCLLARKAGTLIGQRTVAGWLYRAACFQSAKAVRTEQRRQRWEKEAAAMSQHDLKSDEVWEALSPVLDDGLNQLPEKDRLAVLLRFFQRKPMREVGEALGVSEAAAKMRVGRAVEQLRHYFGRRGITCSSAALAILLVEKTAQAAPEMFTASVSKTALAGSVASSVSTLSLVHILTLMTRTKATLLTGAVIAAVALLIAGPRFFRSASSSKQTADSATPSTAGAAQADQTAASSPAGVVVGKKAGTSSPEQMRLEEAKTALQAALRIKKKDLSTATDEIKQALEKFGDDRKAAFDVLVKEFQDASQHPDAPGTPWNSNRGVREAALWAIGQIGQSVPEAAPFLWDTIHSSTGSDWDKTPALASLHAIGFTSKDLPDLTELLASPQRVLASRWISDLLQQDPAGSAAFVPAITKLLDAPDQNTRAFSALALLQSGGTSDARTIQEIQKLFADPGDRQNGVYRVWALNGLKDAGAAAKPLIPDLLAYATTVTDVGSATKAYEVVAAIDPGMAQLVPQVAQALEEQANQEQWAQKWNSGSYTYDDLLAGLKVPGQALTAATHLGERGASAEDAVPAMIAALEGKDETTRDKILENIQKIDPHVSVPKVSAETFMIGIVHASSVFATRPKTRADALLDNLMTRDQIRGWLTREEVAHYAAHLAAIDPAVSQAFVTGVLSQDPSLESVLQPGSAAK